MDEARRQLVTTTILRGGSLDEVAEAIAGAELEDAPIYITRLGSRYRWSPSHQGGPYPLHRVVARLIDVPHTSFALPFTTVDDRAIVGYEDEGADAWAWFERNRANQGDVRERIEADLTDA